VKIELFFVVSHPKSTNMNKAELIDQIAKDAGITKAQANGALDSFTSGIISTLKKGDTVTMVGFGTFSVSQRAARNGRNPQTGETIKIKASKVAKFKPGKDFKEKIAGAKKAKK
jgi:DNA-binding protein HU-beta